jgi:hypothetical protein
VNIIKNSVFIVIAALAGSAFAQDAATAATDRSSDAGPLSLGTTTGAQIGLGAGYYYYREPNLGVTSHAIKGSVDAAGTYHFSNGMFVRGEADYSNGPASYSSASGNKTTPNFYYEIRALFGTDIAVAGSDFSPFTGIGYRYLEDKFAGLISPGVFGYNRQSQYIYVPLGVTQRMHIGSASNRLATTFEFDYLLFGHEKSSLSTSGLVGFDGITEYDDSNNNQRHGYALRLSSMYETRSWSIGPYLTYWNIGRSTVSQVTVKQFRTTTILGFIEPKNNTTEVGVKVAYRF